MTQATEDTGGSWVFWVSPVGVLAAVPFAAPFPVAILTVLLSPAIIVAAAAYRTKVVRPRDRVLRGLCPSCGYDRRGLAGGAKCPECGTAPTRG